ncbi:TPA: hypothetical protein ACPP6U_000174 [Haemophilus influenzae]|uniref:hypothetical protein n=2 Tax=Haemophilus influenzae TaxID=727 RepID=UPI001290259E|nr:hypothetical protein [Haemophilus influenzae]
MKEMIALILFLIAAPIYLLIAGLFIGGTYLINILPAFIVIYLLLVFLAVMLTPFKPWFNRNRAKINSSGKLILLVLFGPLIAVLTISIIALPFVMIYAIADNPFLWYAVILLFVFVYGFIIRNSIKRKEEERIWEKTRERAALHKERYFYGEQKYTKED